MASQLAALEKAAEGMGLVVPTEQRYVDEGYSGSRLDRPSRDALRDAASDGLLDRVRVYAPDRLRVLAPLPRRQFAEGDAVKLQAAHSLHEPLGTHHHR